MFTKKPSKILEENIDQLLEICFTNHPIKNMRAHALTGFYLLLSFDNLVEKAQITDNNYNNNYDRISKFLWHSIWITDNVESDKNQLESDWLVILFEILFQTYLNNL